MILVWYLTVFIPHFEYDNLIHIKILAFLFKTLKKYFDQNINKLTVNDYCFSF